MRESIDRNFVYRLYLTPVVAVGITHPASTMGSAKQDNCGIWLVHLRVACNKWCVPRLPTLGGRHPLLLKHTAKSCQMTNQQEIWLALKYIDKRVIKSMPVRHADS